MNNGGLPSSATHPPAQQSGHPPLGGGTCIFPNIGENPDKPTHPPSDPPPPPRYSINQPLSKGLPLAPPLRDNRAVAGRAVPPPRPQTQRVHNQPPLPPPIHSTGAHVRTPGRTTRRTHLALMPPPTPPAQHRRAGGPPRSVPSDPCSDRRTCGTGTTRGGGGGLAQGLGI